MKRGPDAAMAVVRRLTDSAAGARLEARIDVARSRDWASATFAGARHVVTIDLPDDAAAHGWLDGLPDADLPVRGHLIADVAVVTRHVEAGRIVATAEVLTVVDG